MNSLNVKHQGKSSNQLTFHQSAYDKNDMQKKVTVLVRLHEATQEKWKTAS